MPEFRLVQISDTHLARRLPLLTDNFHRVREYINARRPDLVVNTGDLGWDGPTSPDDLEFARTLHAELSVPCRFIPGNHDIGDNPSDVGPPPSQPVTERDLGNYIAMYGEDRWCVEAAGWCFIGLNAMVMNTGFPGEAEQIDWLAEQLAGVKGRQVALFLHKPLFLESPDEPQLAATALRYIPVQPRNRLLQMMSQVDLRLVASGHVHQRRDFSFGHVRHIWAPSVGFFFSDKRQEVIGTKEVGFVEYRFKPDSFEVFHLKAPGQIDVDLDSLS
jgi:3',5'-cyclic AMP phosphodiesterase CpdA